MIEVELFGFDSVTLSWAASGEPSREWLRFLTYLAGSTPEGVVHLNAFSMPVGVFLWHRVRIYSELQTRDLSVLNGTRLLSLAATWKSHLNLMEKALSSERPALLSDDEIAEKLKTQGWDLEQRHPTQFQFRNIGEMVGIPHAANFSVPGSGKTTATLALHYLERANDNVDSLLVVCPRSAFKEWSETLQAVSGDNPLGFLPLSDGSKIPGLLASRPRFSLITYHQLTRVVEPIQQYLASRRTHLVLDESHRIKSGVVGAISRSCLNIAGLAARRDILSGTPLPQSIEDLRPQLEFLLPGGRLFDRAFANDYEESSIRGLYTRTRYSQLGIGTITTTYEWRDLTPTQLSLYSYLRDDLVRLRTLAGVDVDEQGAQVCVMRLLQASIDPQLAAGSILKADHVPNPLFLLAKAVTEEGEIGGRLAGVIEEARSRALAGKKTVIWAPFVETINRIAASLSDVGAQYIHGRRMKVQDEDVEFMANEQILEDFLTNSETYVLVINSAMSEGLNFHTVCQHAIYAGRTFNAAHFLQSRDRINRLGMPEGASATMSIYGTKTPEGIGSIDKYLDTRLKDKVLNMARILDDEDLRVVALDGPEEGPLFADLSFDEIMDLIDSLS